MTDKGVARWRVVFSGRVQHVGFRYTAYYLAKALYLTGWVDNLPDGRVEMEAQGPVALLRRLVLQLKSRPHIRITDMEIEELRSYGIISAQARLLQDLSRFSRRWRGK